MLRLASSLDMENRQLVSAVGALIQHLRAEIFALDGGHIRVADVQTLRVDEYVRIDSGTFQSLQIFCEGDDANFQHDLLPIPVSCGVICRRTSIAV